VNPFLSSLLNEEIERANFLKNKIKFPLTYPELTGLANRCLNNFDSQIELLENIRKNEEQYTERSIWRWVRSAHRTIEMTEKYGIPPLYYQTEEIGFLNNLIFKICTEVNLPLQHPSVACLSTDYYYTTAFIDVIFVPLSESGFLLHLADLYHELGHYVSTNKKEDKLKSELESYVKAYETITEYFTDFILKLQHERNPEPIILKSQNFLNNWQKNWIEEFFCDLFATFLLGPAYVWSHHYLVAKNNPNIYSISQFGNQDHPPDNARMKILLFALDCLGFHDEQKKIEKEWQIIKDDWGSPPTDFSFAFPDDLLESVAKIIYSGLTSSQVSVYTKNVFDSDSNTVRKTLNVAWQNFWLSSPSDFRSWESSTIDGLKQNFVNS